MHDIVQTIDGLQWFYLLIECKVSLKTFPEQKCDLTILRLPSSDYYRFYERQTDFQ